jgi:hypothetical protein
LNPSICSATPLKLLMTTSIGMAAVLVVKMLQVLWTPVVPVSQSTAICIVPGTAPALCVLKSPDTVSATASTAPAARAPIQSFFCGFTVDLR